MSDPVLTRTRLGYKSLTLESQLDSRHDKWYARCKLDIPPQASGKGETRKEAEDGAISELGMHVGLETKWTYMADAQPTDNERCYLCAYQLPLRDDWDAPNTGVYLWYEGEWVSPTTYQPSDYEKIYAWAERPPLPEPPPLRKS